ncbi:hypothetical protein [Neosynechococcus sphagnicola]|uniref:hypothetical protein n=1 Tax=Neosynechococcus sphagnicola TaxID=1501145 RepID=UPI001EF9FF86|nr:hypothetical protein [Neosynechococcus sphagnicola]
MKMHPLPTTILMLLTVLLGSQSVNAESTNVQRVRQTLSETVAESEGAIAQLRAQGATGLTAFLQVYGGELATHNPHLLRVLDAICQQRDCEASRLFWYTDFAQARAAAQASGKPILSLRLLGQLDADLSCANSRFFRVALYPNVQVAQLLRDRFILHWQSLRPVPKVTIDFGDGRKLERTLTGNSIHYILDSDGNPVDALPGLYGPQAFLRHLQRAEQLVQHLQSLSAADRVTALGQFHQAQLATIQNQWATDLAQLGIPNPPRLVGTPIRQTTPPTAIAAAPIAYAKARVETPLLSAITPSSSPPSNGDR